MPNITLSIPWELHQIVKQHNEIKWSEIARRAMWEQAKKVQLMDKLTENSEFSEEDVAFLDHKVKERLLKRLSK
ncbi:MAG: hypothetical protein KAW47_11040 [Thermoplasmatales archaeon]|nr:hypothetical protein [Thermoplasmatales archaeon]